MQYALSNGRAVEEALAVKHSKRNQLVRDGLLTSPIQRSATDHVWPTSEINQIAAAIVAGLPDDEMRALVSNLHAERKSLLDKVRKSYGVKVTGTELMSEVA
jgi:hypothetical protein